MTVLPSWQQYEKPVDQVMHAASWGNTHVTQLPMTEKAEVHETVPTNTQVAGKSEADLLVHEDSLDVDQAEDTQEETPEADEQSNQKKVTAYNNRSGKTIGAVSEKAVEHSPALDPAKTTPPPSRTPRPSLKPVPTVPPQPIPTQIPEPTKEPGPTTQPSPVPVEPPIVIPPPNPSVPPCSCSPQPIEHTHADEIICPMVLCPIEATK